jgi:pimeloyl-ACP methyl ester carboxylesterase
MDEVLFNGVPIHFDEEGVGPAVLLLHAFPLSSQMWSAQKASLKDAFRVIALDFPGFGQSRPLAGPATMDLFAQAALAVLDALAVERAAVVGLSMGGYASFALHARAPGRVAALGLCDTRAGVDTEEGRKGREATAQAVEQQGSGVLVERMMPALLSKGASPSVRAEVERLIRATPREGAAAALRAMATREDFSSRLTRITCPTLVLVGADDALTPPLESQRMARDIPGATYREIPGAGHLSHFEQPDAFNAAVRAFLEQAKGRPLIP